MTWRSRSGQLSRVFYRRYGIPLSAARFLFPRGDRLIGPDLDLDAAVEHEIDAEDQSRWLVLGEEFAIGAVYLGEVTRIAQPHRGIDDIFQRAARFLQARFDIA